MSDEGRETMQQELMDLGVWLIEHPEAATKNLKPIRDRATMSCDDSLLPLRRTAAAGRF
jgi:hypothetical protein